MQNLTTTNIMSTAAPAKTVAKRVAKKDAAPAAVVPAPVAAAAPVAAPVEKKTKKAAAAAVTAAAAPVVVSSTPVESAAAEAPVAPTTTLDEDIKTVTGNLNSLRETLSTLLGQVKRLEKRVHRELKDARKRKRRVRETGPDGVEVKRAPSIFERPTQITEELCSFLGRSKGTLMSRSEVTKAVNNYVKEKNLKNKHTIVADAPLRKLLSITEADTLTYFNLQKYLNRHYVKAVPVVVAA